LTTAMVGWLMADYKYPLFELWNVFSRGLIIMASTIMFPENRFYTHVVTMSLSLFITLVIRPYKDMETNITSILFCSVDLLGAISAWQSSTSFAAQGGEPTPGVQFIFVVALLVTMLIVLLLSLKAIMERIVTISMSLKHNKKRSVCDGYTRCEIMFLFPIMILVYVVDKFARTCCLKPCLCINKTCGCCSKKKKSKTKVTPESEKIIDAIAEEDKKKLRLERKQKSSSFLAKNTKKDADQKAQDERNAASVKNDAKRVQNNKAQAMTGAEDKFTAANAAAKKSVAALADLTTAADTAKGKLAFCFFIHGLPEFELIVFFHFLCLFFRKRRRSVRCCRKGDRFT